ncbi:MAG TPA: hypothetical protein DDE71_00315 [Tenacibaculum sp.]|nr:hypothetical protein [Tenacibaculum sp.]
MKKLIFIIFISLSINAFSQLAVTDPTANVTLKSQLVTATQQLSQLERNYQIIKEGHEKYQKVNSLVSTVSNIEEIIRLQREGIRNISLVMRHTNLKGNSKVRLVQILKRLSHAIITKTENISKIVKTGFFSMNDKERIDMFQKERNAIYTLVVKTRGYANPYKNR